MPVVANRPDNVLLLGFTNLREGRTARPMVIERGRGVFIFDEDGRDYLEACSTFYCTALGFSDEDLIDAALRQMRALPSYVSAAYRTAPVVIALAERLAALAPFPGARVAFGATGSEANDFLLKFMRFRNAARGERRRTKVISRLGSYHGGTIATAAHGGSHALHDAFNLPLDDVVLVSQPDFFNAGLPGEAEAEFVARLQAELEGAITAAGPEAVGAFLVEPLSFSAGLAVPPRGYFEMVARTLDRHGIPLFDDEVVTGFGRTGSMFGCQSLGFVPACMTVAKALSSAYQPISAVILGPEFYEDLERGSDAAGLFQHAGTYAGHPVAAAVALRTLELIEERGLLAHVAAVAPALQEGLLALRGHPLVADVRCHGLAGAVQFRRVGGTIGRAGQLAQDAARRSGLIVRPVGDSIVVAPPLIIAAHEVAELLRRLGQALEAVQQAVYQAEAALA